MSLTAWRTVRSVVVKGEQLTRALECGHRQTKPLDYLADAARANPQMMVGKRVPCRECEIRARFSGPEPPTEAA